MKVLRNSMILPVILLTLLVGGNALAMDSWTIKSGDTLYVIMKQAMPGQTITQDKIRQVVQQNPQAFENGNAAKLIIGATLNFGAAANNAATATIAKAAPKTTNSQPIAHVVVSAGMATANGTTNGRRVLQRNTMIYEGDTIATSASTHTQIRFVDGALIALRPNTEFRIKQYNYAGREDGSESSFFELAKGGFRTITGAIGHTNKNNYRVTTPVATIGIRGTHYGVSLCQDNNCKKDGGLKDGLYGGVVDGEIIVNNQTGEHTFGNDEYFNVAGLDKRPESLLVPPPVVFDGNELQPDVKRPDDKQKDEKQDPIVQEDNKEDGSKVDRRQFADEGGNAAQELNREQQMQRPGFAPRPEQGEETGNAGSNIELGERAPPTARMLISLIDLLPLGSTLNNAATTVVNGALVEPHPTTGVLESGDERRFIRVARFVASDGVTELIVPIAAREVGKNNDGSVVDHRFFAGTAQLNDLDRNKNYGITWGRWTGGYSLTANGLAIAQGPNLHWMYTERVASVDDINKMGTLYSNVGFTYNGQGTNPTDHLGRVGTMSSASMMVNFSSQKITEYVLSFNIGSASYNASAQSNTSLLSVINGSQNIQLQGNVSDTSVTTYLAGKASVVFLPGSNSVVPNGPISGAASTFSLAAVEGSTNPNITAQGAVIMEASCVNSACN
ncbi:MAG: FecR domain-containing protein [Gammaproteobacteria bacterium]|nr:FecR domain-containing protein [Gammaproteobacteria bacterium]